MSTLQRLEEFYGITSDSVTIPQRRQRRKWTKENKFGFLAELLKRGMPLHCERLERMLSTDTFGANEERFIQQIYDYYIFPFKQSTGNQCQTPTSCVANLEELEIIQGDDSAQKNSDSQSNSDSRSHSHHRLKQALLQRDTVCLICWKGLGLHAAHIIVEKNALVIPVDEQSILERAGLSHIHEPSNGLLLCAGVAMEDSMLLKDILTRKWPIHRKIFDSSHSNFRT
jgi:hypothetical protein